MTIRRKIALTGTTLGLAGLASAFAVAMPAEEAAAHGGLTFPETRTYACYVNGREGSDTGDLNPTNPMCAAAWEEDIYPFWNWFGNLLPDADGNHQAIIPDGELCGPGQGFGAFNAAPAGEWPTTQLASGADITFNYNAWAQHPGTWSQYITTDDWDPDTPLSWDELEEVPFDEVTDPPLRDGGPEGPEYYWDATLPDKVGQHIIYSIWQRSDSPEAFYNCSDVFFVDGGEEGAGGADEAEDAGAVDSAAGGAAIDTVAARDAIAGHEHGSIDAAALAANSQQLPAGGLTAGHLALSAVGGLLAGIVLTLTLRRRQQLGSRHHA